jgi:hypothetical protein
MPHPIPDAVLTQHLAVLGKTGTGKSYLTRSIVERLLDAGRRVCILDYTGVWFGLRSSANGRKGAYPIVIFGGEHGDVPLNEIAGPAIAKLVAGGNRPSIIDLDGLTIGAQQRFVTAFLEELYRLNTQPLHLVLEEIDEFAPRTGAPGTERMLGAVARIFQRGRRKGFRAIAITQRPANAHKRVLAQCNALVTLRLVAPQDRKAVAEWIRGHADDEVGRQVVDSLPKLFRRGHHLDIDRIHDCLLSDFYKPGLLATPKVFFQGSGQSPERSLDAPYVKQDWQTHQPQPLALEGVALEGCGAARPATESVVGDTARLASYRRGEPFRAPPRQRNARGELKGDHDVEKCACRRRRRTDRCGSGRGSYAACRRCKLQGRIPTGEDPRQLGLQAQDPETANQGQDAGQRRQTRWLDAYTKSQCEASGLNCA